MASSTSYHEWIKELIGSGYSNLKFLDERVMQKPDHGDATCTILRFSENGVLESSGLVSDADFDKSTVGKSKRLFILEGITQTYVEKLGSMLDIEPEFFAGHLRSVTWEHYDDRSDAVMLPSVRKQTKFWTLEYFECVRLDGKFRLGRTRLLPFMPIFRRLFIRNPYMDQKEKYSVGLASRLISFWEQSSSNGNFDAVLLVDTPFKAKLNFEYDDVKSLQPMSTTWMPYGGGFIDFTNIDHRRAFVQHSPQYPESRNGSVKEALLWRLKHPDIFRSAQGRPAGIVLQRLVLSQWALTLAFLRRDFNSIHIRSLSGENVTLSQVKSTLVDLESCRALLDRCLHLVRKSLSQLDIATVDDSPRAPSAANGMTDAELLQIDWRFIWQECQHWMNETERMLNLRLTNLSVLDSKRSRDDSERAWADSQRSARLSESSNQITKLGQILLLFFTPAALAYGLLSMGGEFAPGKKQFWIFFAIAVPLSMVTFSLFYLWVYWSNRRMKRSLDRGYQEWERPDAMKEEA
ncbi:hypothetical protein P154DRAFT_619907 [Amniculicola lignicola CBS 123094]|uniref:Uncharacterized protein n=1 Tax=Amniculicola lignicola CBS 123094 TaxID=1392246 RepID=A0A6A5WFI4_9PLEO|nr:hypothetical protein P154DRAFT_619907 [Amniculicola lignicola CBS 123094]